MNTSHVIFRRAAAGLCGCLFAALATHAWAIGDENAARVPEARSATDTSAGGGALGATGNNDNAAIRIGTAGVQTSAYVAGIYGATASSGAPVYVDSSGRLGTATSSARFKDDIHDIRADSEALYALRPVGYHYKPELDPALTPQFGLVAEEVEKINPALVVHDPDGRPYSVRYEQVNAMLLNEFLKEHAAVQSQAAEILKLKQTVAEQAAAFTRQQERMDAALDRIEALAPPPPQPAVGR